MNLTTLEQAVLPLACPLLSTLWTGTLFPAIQNGLKSASPEIQIAESAIGTMINSIVTAELQKLATL